MADLRLLRKLFDPTSTGLRQAYVKSMLFWNPLIIFIFCLFLGDIGSLLHRWLVSLTIGTIVSQVCFGATFLARFIDGTLAKRKGRSLPVRSRAWWYSISASAMPLGLYVAFKLMDFIRPLLGWESSPANVDDYRFGFLLGTLIAGVFFLLQTRSEARESARAAELKLKKIENERLQAQIAALTAQMNPHLLFNALNTVAALVATEPRKAEDIIIKLSELYRGVLDSSRNMTHPLADEIGICESYLAVEQARFGERLKSKIVIDPKIDSHAVEIPALSLQPLIENAVRHGLSSRSSGGEVILTAKDENGKLKILVEDNGVGFSHSEFSAFKKGGAGSGIKNCRERLKLHFGDTGNFEISNRAGGGTVVALTIPAQLKGGIAT